MELGGLLGSLIAGRISDWYIATSPGGAVGKRIQVVMAYLIGVAAMLAAFQAVPSGKLLSSKYKAELTRYKIPILQALIVFMIGFFLYGPQMLIGTPDDWHEEVALPFHLMMRSYTQGCAGRKLLAAVLLERVKGSWVGLHTWYFLCTVSKRNIF